MNVHEQLKSFERQPPQQPVDSGGRRRLLAVLSVSLVMAGGTIFTNEV